MIFDEHGIMGSLIHYSMVIFFVSSAFIIFLYLWKKGRLDMDESPKYKMLQDEQDDLDKLEVNKK